MLRKLAKPKPSEFIDTIWYDVETEIMEILFLNGNRVRCDYVSAKVASMLEQPGASYGKIWHAHLKQLTWTPC